MKRKIFILIPKFNNDSPIKGAIALANGLTNNYHVTVISINSLFSFSGYIDRSINIILLDKLKLNFISKIRHINKIMSDTNYLDKKIVISYCILPDLINILLKNNNLFRITSIRANLYKDYYYKFNFLGYCLALFHYFIFTKMDICTAMHEQMKEQINIYNSNVKIIKNFIDEKSITRNLECTSSKLINKKKINLVFVGSLIKRKNLFSLLKVIKKAIDKNKQLNLHILGDGYLREKLYKFTSNYNLKKNVFIYSHLSNPFQFIYKCDYLVSTSYSEGTSRSVIESLFLGTPVIIKNIDGNSELISKENGYLFNNENELLKILEELKHNDHTKDQIRLLPSEYSQKNCCLKFQEILNID